MTTLAEKNAATRYWKTPRGKAVLKSKRRRKRLRSYGVTEERILQQLVKQGGCCAICSAQITYPSKGTCVDHDHKTGRFRGLLCFNCNIGLGHFKDDPHLLNKARDYVCLVGDLNPWICSNCSASVTYALSFCPICNQAR